MKAVLLFCALSVASVMGMFNTDGTPIVDGSPRPVGRSGLDLAKLKLRGMAASMEPNPPMDALAKQTIAARTYDPVTGLANDPVTGLAIDPAVVSPRIT